MDIEAVLHNPAHFFSTPSEVLDDVEFSAEQHLQILKQWELDLKEMLTMDDENMGGGDEIADLLSEVENAIIQLEDDL